MGNLWNIIQFSFSSLIWGLLIALFCMALFVFIIRGWWKNALFTIWSYLIGAVLFIFLVFQCTMIVGSLKIIETCDEYEMYVRQIVDEVYEEWEEVSKGDADIIIDRAIKEYPLLKYYIDSGEFAGFNAKNLPTVMADELRSFMWAYIIRRLLWCLSFVIVAGVLGIMTLNKNNQNQRHMRLNNSSQRHISGTSRRPHISRRR